MKLSHSGLCLPRIIAIAITLFFLGTIQAAAAPFQICDSSGRDSLPNGYHWELWTNKGSGNVCMTVLGEDATFKVKWNNVGNFVARVGLKFDESQKHAALGTVTADYAFTKSDLKNMSYYGIYGWTVEPLVEFYVLEDWYGWNPSKDPKNHTNKGTVTVDGAQYDVWTRVQKDQPSIVGKATFPQIFSIRKQTSQSGHISVSEHFKKWEQMGFKLGNMYEIKIKVEGYSSSGNCDVTKAIIKVNGKIPTEVLSAPGQQVHHQFSFTNNGTSNGVYTLISLTGETVRSMTLNPENPSVFPTDKVPPGMYYLQFKGEGIAPVTRPLFVR